MLDLRAFHAVFLSAALLAAGLQVPVEAQETRQLESLFPQRAAVRAEKSGLQRLTLTPEVLAASRADLGDVRLVDQRGSEIPFLVDSGSRHAEALVETVILTPHLLETERRRQERPGRTVRWIETYHLAPPEATSPTGRWELVVRSGRRSFVRQVRLEAWIGGEARPVDVGPSLFRLTDPRREKTRLPLPVLDADRFVVTLTGGEEGFLEPDFRYEASRRAPLDEASRVELQVLSLSHQENRSILDVERPRGLLPDALILETSTELFRRRVEVTDRGAGAGDRVLGEATLFRISAVEGLEDLELELRPPRGELLRIVIDDGDSPPLAEVTVHARIRRPTLIFALPETALSSGGLWLLFGGGRAYRPRYDLDALLTPLPAGGTEAAAQLLLRDPAHIPASDLAPPEPNPGYDPAPALGFALRPGAEIDTRPYSHRRAITASETGEGLLRLELEPRDLALARPDLADLRVVDDEDRQRPYLLEESSHFHRLPLPISRSSDDRESVYDLQLPVEPSLLDRLELDITAPFFDRQFELVAETEPDGERVVVGRGRLVRRAGDEAPLLLSVPPRPIRSLELRVSDGDDAPLELASATARFPLPSLYVAAPAGSYRLLLGYPDDRPPTYELARARGLVLSVKSVPLSPAALEENPDYSAAARLGTATGLPRLLVWVALGLAVVVLTVLTLHMVRGDPQDPMDG